MNYCRHQHEIKNVIKDWVENTERQGYYVEYCGFPARSGLNPHLTAKRIKASRNQHNNNLAKRTEQRLNAILAALTEIPKQAKAKIAAIRTKSIELFGEAISRNTLYKPAYKPLWFGAEIATLDSNLEKDPTPPSNSPLTITDQQFQPITIENNIPIPAAQTQSETTLSHTPPLYETYVGRVQSSWLHHQLQLCCINLWCQSILDLQSLSVESELASDLPNYSNRPNLDSNLQFTSVTLEIQNLPIHNIYSTENFNNNAIQFEEVAKISSGGESNNDIESPINIEPDLDPVCAIEIGTKLQRHVQQIGQKTYPALANCQVVSANGLDWVVRDREGYSWNVSHHALASGVWEIERDEANVVDVGTRSVVEIARQVRTNLAAIPDALLLEFLHHPDLDAIQGTIELANELVAARSRQQVEALVANLSHCEKLDLWRVLSVEERSAVETLMARATFAPHSSSNVELAESVDNLASCSIGKLVVGATVNTLTGLVGVVKYVFESISKPFLVYHESLGRTILYGSEDLQ